MASDKNCTFNVAFFRSLKNNKKYIIADLLILKRQDIYSRKIERNSCIIDISRCYNCFTLILLNFHTSLL